MMTKKEANQILFILKAAYPNSYKNLTEIEAKSIVMVWASQFANIPADVVFVAVNKLISTNIFPPAISEVKEKISNFYWEAWEALEEHSKYNNLTPAQVESFKRIFEVSERFRNQNRSIEPTIKELTGESQQYLLNE